MKVLMWSVAMSLGFLASGATAEVTVDIDGGTVPLSVLMENCQSIVGDPETQIACFNDLSVLLSSQSDAAPQAAVSPEQALDELIAVAAYQDDETGLSITGTGCGIQFVYFANYYYISRRNVSSIDLFSAFFDASQLDYDQISEVRGAPAPLINASLATGASAITRGGVALESSVHNFDAKSARATLDVYAQDVVTQLPATEGQTFDFVLVHPQRDADSAKIWTAFKTFVTACQ